MSTASGPVLAPITVIIPTHDHASTVDLAIQSVLDQSVWCFELVVIGDGATPDVRAAVAPTLGDRRVRFLDEPKSPSRAELARHRVLSEGRSTFACYLGDDDLMLPGHLAATISRLERVDFTHPLPLFVDRDGRLRAHPTDLADERCRDWHRHDTHNAVSLTGVGHRIDAYRRLAHGWRTAPPGRWSDHYMWQQWFVTPGLRYATGTELTVLKFDASVRTTRTSAARRDELLAWRRRSREPDFSTWLAEQSAHAFRRAAIDLRLDLDERTDELVAQQMRWREAEAYLMARNEGQTAVIGGLRHDLNASRDDLARLLVRAQAAEQQAARRGQELEALRATRTWRLHERLVRHRAPRWLARMAGDGSRRRNP